jgi:hypothetical protein
MNIPTDGGNFNPVGAALAYARHGWRVFPCHNITDAGCCSCGEGNCLSPGKHPRTAHGCKDATIDAGLIWRWWQQWPTANVAVATGKGSGIFVVAPDHAQGVQDLSRLVAVHDGPLPPTIRVRSGSGDGSHLYFNWPAAGTVANSKNHNGLAIDIRGEGGYVIAPPSGHISGGTYAWEIGLDDAPLAEAPPWMLDWVRSGKGAKQAGAFKFKVKGVLDNAIRYLARVDPSVSGQGGHDAALWAARVVVLGFDLGPDVGFDILWKHYNPRCQPPWSEKELRHKCDEAHVVPFDKPRGWLLADDVGGKAHAAQDAKSGGPAPATDENVEPIPLTEPTAPLPAFPLNVLPQVLADYAGELAWANNVPPDYAGGMILALAGGAIGNRRRLQIKHGHTQSACLFLANVAPPGAAKSPTLERVSRPLLDAQLTMHKDWKKKMREWNGQDPKERGEKPVLSRCMVDNFTFERLKPILAANPAGVVMALDELRQVVSCINQYKGGQGTDRQDLLKLWSGAAIINDRCKDEEPVFIPRPFVAIVGNIQPVLVRSLCGDGARGQLVASDGGLDRFLFSYPKDLPLCGETWRTVNTSLELAWENAIKQLLGWQMIQLENDPHPQSRLLHLSGCGRTSWQKFTEVQAKEVNNDSFPEHLRGPWSKLVAYCGRLALILDCLHNVLGDGGDPGRQVSGEMVDRAARLIGYFKAHARKVYLVMDADPRVADARHILKCLARNRDLKTFSRTDLFRLLRGGSSFKRPDSLDRPLKLLVDHQYLFAAVPVRLPGKPGPNPERFTVNPRWDPGINPLDPPDRPEADTSSVSSEFIPGSEEEPTADREVP